MKTRAAVLAFACAVVGCLALFGCSSSEPASDAGQPSGEPQQASQPADAAKDEPQAESKYAVTIDDCKVTTDYRGKPAIVVTYTFTNNSDKATAFMTAISAKCFQNGVQLDYAVVEDADGQSGMNEIKPGATTTVDQSYLLDDESDVSAECTELISLSDDILAEKTFSVA